MNKIDYVSKVIHYCEKRSECLIKGQPISKYNYYFDKMVEFEQKLVAENKQDKLLPYLEDKSISIQYDVATILFKFYPELCINKIKEIADMTIRTGLPKHFTRVSGFAGVALYMLEHGKNK